MKSLRDTGYFLDAEALQSNYFDEYSENRISILKKSLFLLKRFIKSLTDYSSLDKRTKFGLETNF